MDKFKEFAGKATKKSFLLYDFLTYISLPIGLGIGHAIGKKLLLIFPRLTIQQISIPAIILSILFVIAFFSFKKHVLLSEEKRTFIGLWYLEKGLFLWLIAIECGILIMAMC